MLHYPTETKANIKKYLLMLMAVSCAVLYLIYTVALVPLYTYLSTNVLFMGGWLPFTIRLLLEILDVAIFAIAYFSITYAFFRITPKKAIIFPILYIILALFRRLISLLAELISSGHIGTEDFLSLGLYYILDVLQLLAVIAIVCYEYNKCNKFITERKKAGINTPDFLPFSKTLDKNNPLQACSFKLALLISGIKIATRIISDMYYGFPKSLAEGLVMMAYYLSDMLNGLIFYTLLWLLFNYINKKETALSKSMTVSD